MRYDDRGNFSYTISGPAQFLPVVQAGIEAKKAELQRQRDAEAAEDVPAQTPAQPDPEPEPVVGVPAGTWPPLDLDEQAPGWPQGTTRRDARAAAESFVANLPRWRDPDSDLPASPSEQPARHVDDTAVRASARARHHTLIHSQGFGLVLHPDRRLEVSTADGLPLLHHPTQPWADPAALANGCGQDVSAETLPPDHVVARLDLGYVVSVLVAQAS